MKCFRVGENGFLISILTESHENIISIKKEQGAKKKINNLRIRKNPWILQICLPNKIYHPSLPLKSLFGTCHLCLLKSLSLKEPALGVRLWRHPFKILNNL